MARFVGVDGCRFGWVAVAEEAGRLEYRLFGAMSDVLAAHPEVQGLVVRGCEAPHVAVEEAGALRLGGVWTRLGPCRSRRILGDGGAGEGEGGDRREAQSGDHGKSSLGFRDRG